MDKKTYSEFKKQMVKRGHAVSKRGKYITIVPNNNFVEYERGFSCADEVIEGFTEELRFTSMDHYNSRIYKVVFKIV